MKISIKKKFIKYNNFSYHMRQLHAMRLFPQLLQNNIKISQSKKYSKKIFLKKLKKKKVEETIKSWKKFIIYEPSALILMLFDQYFVVDINFHK